MFETITRFASYLEHITFLTYPVAVLLGFLASMTAITCCIGLVPAIAGFVVSQESNSKRFIRIPFFIMLGSIVTLVALGVTVSLTGLTLQKSLGQYWSYFIGVICIIVGLFVLDIIKFPAKFSIPKIKQKGLGTAFLFGLCIGGVIGFGSSCCLPALPIVLTYAAIQGRPIHGALVLGAFAVGQSIPLFAIGLFSSFFGRFTGRWSFYIRRISGILLIIAGIYFIWRG